MFCIVFPVKKFSFLLITMRPSRLMTLGDPSSRYKKLNGPWPGRIGHGRHHDSGRSMPQHIAMSTGCQGNGDGAVQDHSAASLGLLQRLGRWWWGLSRNYTKTSVLESAGVSDGHWKWDEHLRRLQGSRKVAGGALICSVGGMSVRHMSATQSGGCSGLKVVSKVVHVLFVCSCPLLILPILFVCLFVQALLNTYLPATCCMRPAWQKIDKNGTYMN